MSDGDHRHGYVEDSDRLAGHLICKVGDAEYPVTIWRPNRRMGKAHGSRLQFGAWLRYGDDGSDAQDWERELAAEMGIPLGGGQLQGILLEALGVVDAASSAEVVEEPAAGFRIAGGLPTPSVISTAEVAKPRLSLVPPIFNGGSVIAAGAVPATDAPDEVVDVQFAGPKAPAAADDTDTGFVLFRQIEAIEASSGFWNILSSLRMVARAADSNGVGRWGLLGTTLPRVARTVPPHVRLVNATGQEGGPNGGASLNLYSILLGAPEDGKSETIKLAQARVPLPDHAGKATAGTGDPRWRRMLAQRAPDHLQGRLRPARFLHVAERFDDAFTEERRLRVRASPTR